MPTHLTQPEITASHDTLHSTLEFALSTNDYVELSVYHACIPASVGKLADGFDSSMVLLP